MLKTIFILSVIALYVSLPGFFNKAGYNSFKGLIPIYNIYILMDIIKINPIILLIIGVGLITPIRILFATVITIFIPFIISDAYDKNILIGILTLLIPFIMYPLIAYKIGVYRYNLED